ncbi:MAG: competence/damage-inducible protein A [Gemmatimonadaceae bacterium]
MRVELITIGDELLLGFVVDTNAAMLARELAAVGVEIIWRTTVLDDADAIARAVRDALDRTGAAITTGGLGPTSDDMTKPAIAALFGRELRLDEGILAGIEERFRQFGLRTPMPPGNRQQALIPVGARVLANRHGTAPGIWLEDERGRWVAMFPGVPRELRGMLADELIPLLRARAGTNPRVVASRTLRTTGIGESALSEALGELAGGFPEMPLAYNPKWQGTDIRITARNLPVDEAARRLDDGIARLRERAGAFVYGEDDADLAEVVLRDARAAGLRIATAESCTGGLLGGRITAIAGSSDVYLGGIIAYANEVKVSTLGVPPATIVEHGAVSEEVARAMAQGARRAIGSEIGVAITGIAGPGGGSADKPVGTVWIAADVAGSVRAHGRVYVGDREEIRLRATQAALDMIRRAIATGA